MKNKILSTVLLSLLLITNAFGQEEKPLKIHELGLTFANLDNFGIRYKTGNEKTMLRISVLAMNFNANNHWGREEDSITLKNIGYGAGIRVGFEKPNIIVKNFILYYGLDLSGNFNYQNSKHEYPYMNEQSTNWSISAGVAFVFGGTYCVGDHFRFSAEISPWLYYNYGETDNIINDTENTKMTSSGIGFNLSNNGAIITVAYRFIK